MGEKRKCTGGRNRPYENSMQYGRQKASCRMEHILDKAAWEKKKWRN